MLFCEPNRPMTNGILAKSKERVPRRKDTNYNEHTKEPEQVSTRKLSSELKMLVQPTAVVLNNVNL